MNVFNSGVFSVEEINLLDQLLDVVAIKDQVLCEVLNIRVTSCFINFVKDLSDNLVVNDTRDLLNVDHFEWHITVFDKARASLQSINASSEIPLTDLDKCIKNSWRLNLDSLEVTDHAKSFSLGRFTDW